MTATILNYHAMDFRALEEGHPVSGDLIRAFVHDPHPTQPFRMPDILWPMVLEAGEEHFALRDAVPAPVDLDPEPWEATDGSRAARSDAWNKWFKPRDGYATNVNLYIARMESEHLQRVSLAEEAVR